LADYLLEIQDVSKQFPGTLALNKVKLQVKKGEVHALCGENGAGKSTLMNIIGGVFPPTSGRLVFDGKQIRPKSPKDAQDIGIGFVHQELSLCPHLTAAENIFIGRLPRKGDVINFKKLFADADAVLRKFDAQFSSRTPVSELNVSEQQIIEIAKSITLDCKLLILDEPTSSLTDKETAKLFGIVRDVRAQGIGVLCISHRLSEIFEICDRVTVFKDGQYVSTMDIADIAPDDIISAMVGRKIETMYPPKSSGPGEEILRVKGLTSKGVFRDVGFSLNRGEILGFAGLVGSGRSEIMRALCAIDPSDGGQVTLFGEAVSFKSFRDAVSRGVCYLTEDRKSQGLFTEMSIKSNMSSANLKAISRGFLIDARKENALADTYVRRLAIKIPGVDYLISSLSGGNQQKCLVGKWLSISPSIIIMDEPTRGIDVGAKAEIHQLLRGLAEQGVGVIVISSELPEVIGISDRVVVIHEGRVSGALSGRAISEENIMRLASGGASQTAGGEKIG
jgi:ribose transport system ATP-binding protein